MPNRANNVKEGVFPSFEEGRSRADQQSNATDRTRRGQGRSDFRLQIRPPPPRRYSCGSVTLLNRRGNPSSKEGKTCYRVDSLENTVGIPAGTRCFLPNLDAKWHMVLPFGSVRGQTRTRLSDLDNGVAELPRFVELGDERRKTHSLLSN